MEQVCTSKLSFPPERMSVCRLPVKSRLRDSFQYCLWEDCLLASAHAMPRTTVTLFIIPGDVPELCLLCYYRCGFRYHWRGQGDEAVLPGEIRNIRTPQFAESGNKEGETAKAWKITKKVYEIYSELLFSKSHSTGTRGYLTSRRWFLNG